jgi:hemolysin activation/secretion protein
VGNVALAGGEHLNRTKLARGVRSEAGDVLTTRSLHADLDWLNRNRFHDARLAVAPGAALAEADLLFSLSDERPILLFGGFENSGVDVVGEERWVAGFDWGNAFGLGHRMVYQATLGADIEAFRAHALDYRLPLPWRHELGIQAAIAKSEVALDGDIATEGTSWLLGAAYTVPLPRLLDGALRHEISLGFQWKSTDNNLEFGGAEIFASAAEIGQFSARYSGALDRERATTHFDGIFIVSPGDLGGDNTDAAFAGIRGDAVSEYSALRGSVSHVRHLAGGGAVVLRAGGQWTDAPLLPSEQYWLGGHDTVRGYGEREGLGDLGYYGSLEIRAPGFGFVSNVEDRLQLLGFVDYGRSWAKGGHGGASDRELSAAGPGLRYRVGERASLRADYGWKLDGEGSRVHIGVRVEL